MPAAISSDKCGRRGVRRHRPPAQASDTRSRASSGRASGRVMIAFLLAQEGFSAPVSPAASLSTRPLERLATRWRLAMDEDGKLQAPETSAKLASAWRAAKRSAVCAASLCSGVSGRAGCRAARAWAPRGRAPGATISEARDVSASPGKSRERKSGAVPQGARECGRRSSSMSSPVSVVRQPGTGPRSPQSAGTCSALSGIPRSKVQSESENDVVEAARAFRHGPFTFGLGRKNQVLIQLVAVQQD